MLRQMKAIHLATQSGEQHEDLLTQDEVAARLKVTLRTVIRLQHDGVLPVIFVGKAVRFYWPAVISHLISNFTVCRSLRSATMPHGPSVRPNNKGGQP
jgi:excisionase family DNA binding protein